MRHKVILITGGAGFIGSNFALHCIAEGRSLINLDKLTYAGSLSNLKGLEGTPNHVFVRGDISGSELIARIFNQYRPSAIVHFAAETHVDRSILAPDDFIQTNLVGTHKLLQASLRYWEKCECRESFRFLHVSTDEVYGSLALDAPPVRENASYSPNSPYAASKAGADHLVKAYHSTYDLPVLTAHCSNNYGPRQFPEKLIPLIILNAIDGRNLPVYGDGQNIRDWLYVADNCDAIATLLEKGQPGETYNVGGSNEKTNLEVVTMICEIMDELHPAGRPHSELISFVKDRPGHDRRYAMDCSKLQNALGWYPRENFSTGLRKTVQWYLHNINWVKEVTSGRYREWISANYSERKTPCEA